MSESTPNTGDEDAAMLRTFLAARDVPCPRCGYNLRAATGDRCAECGTVVRLGVSPVEPVMRAWVVALVFASIGAGIGVLFLALVVGRAGMPPSEWYWLIGLSWTCIPAAVALSLLRRRFVRLSAGAQWSIAAAFAVADVAMFVGLMFIR